MQFGDPGAFAELLRACGDIDGLERVRFTSPHPRDFSDDVIAAMAETSNVMPQLHPLQSGSDDVLRRMRRSYRRERYLGIVDRVRRAMPHAAITTDIIVGFPGETEADFLATRDVVRQARFAAAFTFQYSARPGTPAASMPEQVPPDVVADRYQRLVDVVEDVAWAENRALVGTEVEVLLGVGEGRKDEHTHRVSGRARDNRLVHLDPGDLTLVPGDLVTATVTTPRRTTCSPTTACDWFDSAGHRPANRGAACRQPGRGSSSAGAVPLGVPSMPRGDRRPRLPIATLMGNERNPEPDELVAAADSAEAGPPVVAVVGATATGKSQWPSSLPGQSAARSSMPTRCSCIAGWTSGPRRFRCRRDVGSASPA